MPGDSLANLEGVSDHAAVGASSEPSYEPQTRPFDFDWLLFWYRNDHKVEALFSQLNGRLEAERKETVSKGRGTTGKLGVDIGGLLATLGLAKVTGGGEIRSDYEQVLEITSSLSIENKTALLLAYFQKEGQLAQIELFATQPHDIVDGAIRSRFQVISGAFRYVSIDDKRGELHSAMRRADSDLPFIRVPFFHELETPNQSLPILDEAEEEPFAHEVFCQCIRRAGWILANPIVIWLPWIDPDTGDDYTWSTGATTEM